MFLKKLEIQGFKSFPDRTNVDFVPGITAVVGPNGSGKSNIIDAIRWVLGEQSAKSLRGAKMEDIIFSGSETRKRSNRAEVTLVLDNASSLFPFAHPEVRVTRIVYRSGESEYYLNGEKCRLKDITDLFIDSGVGKAGFSIISQGRVDEILNSPPEKRRLIFDEAAGVLKYKTRKKDAERKLENTKEHLDRVLDILHELDGRLLPLQKQAEQAKKAQVLDEKIVALDRTLLTDEALRLHAIIEQLDERERQWKVEHEAERQTLRQLREEVVALEKTVERLDAERSTLYEQQIEAKTTLERWEGKRLVRSEREKRMTEDKERLHQALQDVERKLQLKRQEENEKKQRVENIQQSLHALSVQMEAIRQSLHQSVEEIEAQLEQEKAIYIDVLNEEANIRNRIQWIEEQTEKEQRITPSDTTKEETLKVQYEEAQKEVEAMRQLLQQTETDYSAQREQLEKLKTTFERYEASVNEQRQLLRQAQERVYELNQRKQVLERMQQEKSGFYAGVKSILLAAEQGQLTGIEGAVAQLLTIPNAYLIAFDTALGASAQHIVVQTTEDAKRSIYHLKKMNKGRATFLPIDTMRPRVIPRAIADKLQTVEGFVGIASQLASYDERYERVIQNLLGTTIVAQTIDDATTIAKMIHHKFKIVTLDGDVIYAGGSLSGGARRNQSPLFTQKAEYDQTVQQLTQFTTTLQRAKEKTEATDRATSLAFEHYLRAKEEVEQIQKEMVEKKEAFQQLQFQYRTIEADWNHYTHQKSEREATVAQNKEALRTLRNDHEAVQQKVEKTRVMIETLEKRLQNSREEEKKMEQRHQKMREEHVTLEQQLKYERENYERVVEERRQEQKALKEIEKQRQQIEREEGIEHSREEIEAAIQLWTRHVEEREQRAKQIEQTREQTQQQFIDKNEALTVLERSFSKEEEKYNEWQVERSKRATTFQHVMQQLKMKYSATTLERPDEQFDRVKASEQLAQYERERKQVGAVNPLAITEYEEVLERHTFLTTQRNDLVEAKETLLEAMDEMDEEMTERFSVTFGAIRHQFQQVFRQMFGGGEADLQLTNPHSLLTTGVEIVARPPGKKLQNLRLLSGGERALTAITLLFAMIEVRPVPFCILDEVEAALDEANVTRYSHYLNTFADETQFIVITHRKGTMEGADVLYGVTMQESGVSKLLSVQLSELEQYENKG